MKKSKIIKTRSLILIFFILPFLYANKCKKKVENEQTTKSQKIKVKNAYIDKEYDFTVFEKKYIIKNADLKDSLLTLTIEADICDDDNIDLVMNGNFLKSYPPKAHLGLKFNENTNCQKNTIIRTFNINPVKYQHGHTTIFLIKNWQPIKYNY